MNGLYFKEQAYHVLSLIKEVRFYTTIAKGFRKPILICRFSALPRMGRFFTKLLTCEINNRGRTAIINLDNSVGGFVLDSYFIDNDARLYLSLYEDL